MEPRDLRDQRNDGLIVEHKAPNWLVGLTVLALLAALGALGWALGLQNHLTVAEGKLNSATQQNAALAEKIEDTNERLRAQGEALGQTVGLTQKQLEERSAQLAAAQKNVAVTTRNLQRQEVANQKAVDKKATLPSPEACPNQESAHFRFGMSGPFADRGLSFSCAVVEQRKETGGKSRLLLLLPIVPTFFCPSWRQSEPNLRASALRLQPLLIARSGISAVNQEQR